MINFDVNVNDVLELLDDNSYKLYFDNNPIVSYRLGKNSTVFLDSYIEIYNLNTGEVEQVAFEDIANVNQRITVYSDVRDTLHLIIDFRKAAKYFNQVVNSILNRV